MTSTSILVRFGLESDFFLIQFLASPGRLGFLAQELLVVVVPGAFRTNVNYFKQNC